MGGGCRWLAGRGAGARRAMRTGRAARRAGPGGRCGTGWSLRQVPARRDASGGSRRPPDKPKKKAVGVSGFRAWPRAVPLPALGLRARQQPPGSEQLEQALDVGVGPDGHAQQPGRPQRGERPRRDAGQQPRGDRVGVADLDRHEVGVRGQPGGRAGQTVASRARRRALCPGAAHLGGIVEAGQRRQRGQSADVVVVARLATAAAIDAGPASQPTRMPASPNSFENVRSDATLGRARTCSAIASVTDPGWPGRRTRSRPRRRPPARARARRPGSRELSGVDDAAGRVVRRADPDQARPRPDAPAIASRSIAPSRSGTRDDGRLLLGRVGQVGRKRGPAGHDLVARAQVRRATGSR